MFAARLIVLEIYSQVMTVAYRYLSDGTMVYIFQM